MKGFEQTRLRPPAAGAGAVLELDFGLSLSDLYERDGLRRLDAAFVEFLRRGDEDLRARLERARAEPETLQRKSESELLMALAPQLEDFLVDLFGIRAQAAALAARHHELAPLYTCKRLFVQRRAMKQFSPAEAARLDGGALRMQLEEYLGRPFDELAFAVKVAFWQHDESAYEAELQVATQYAAWAAMAPEGRERHRRGILFKAPAKLVFERLVPVQVDDRLGYVSYRAEDQHIRRRTGFALTDPGADLAGALDEANYCIWCHHQDKDSCSHGLKEKPPATGGVAPFRKSPFGVTLAGCPLEEKISEFQELKANGFALGE